MLYIMLKKRIDIIFVVMTLCTLVICSCHSKRSSFEKCFSKEIPKNLILQNEVLQKQGDFKDVTYYGLFSGSEFEFDNLMITLNLTKCENWDGIIPPARSPTDKWWFPPDPTTQSRYAKRAQWLGESRAKGITNVIFYNNKIWVFHAGLPR